MRDGRTVIANQEAEIIREIFEAYIKGASLKDIADELTERKIPYTEKTCRWDKARIARILANAKYLGTEEYDPIVDEKMYDTAADLKAARLRNACEKENGAIELIRDSVRCDCCGYSMRRRISAKHRIRESWECTNPECGIRVRISDAQFIEVLTTLINRIILNIELLQPSPQKRYEPDLEITKVNNDIALELERDNPSERYIMEKTIEMASLMYKQTRTKCDLTASITKRMAQTMVVQDDFNPNYFSTLTSYISLGPQGKVAIHTKTETEVTMDNGS